ncbi:MAG: lmo0937 family membrane protein [Taibaiella sp.]|nr:lmo0937 family membrane protein [Taibaiella sp.]
MRNLLYLIAVILVFGWLLGFFYFRPAGNLIHTLLVLALISVVLGLFSKNDYD